MPVVGKVFGGLDFTSKYVVLSGDVAAGTPLDAAPLTQAGDALLLDTSDMYADAAVAAAIRLVEAKLAG